MGIKTITIVGILVMALLAAFFYEENRRVEAARLPEGGADLIIFLEARPNASGIRKFVRNKKVHIEVFGEVVFSLLSVASGPPAYVFDETGKLVEWTADRGSDAVFKKKWGNLGEGTFIGAEDAKRIVKRARGKILSSITGKKHHSFCVELMEAVFLRNHKSQHSLSSQPTLPEFLFSRAAIKV
ncbi:MAG: hypothetical protein LBD14_06635 [Puniceicoccales bacterium]|nr:hypothetical protein [Puniceicoccales bacterium]